MSNCYTFARKQKEAQEEAKQKYKPAGKARAAMEQPQDATEVMESAGQVSLTISAPTLETHRDWNADTGATSHMTPHRHWFHIYEPLRVPIKLADNTIVYSAGVGNVTFTPVVNGKEIRPVEFTRVLHVPNLRNNLLSVLFLTRQRKFKVAIDADFIYFNLAGQTRFVASINDHNSAFLDGSTKSHHIDSAQLTSTLPLTYSLWHCRLAHVNRDDVKKLITQNFVTGIKLDSRIAPDPICEPCLAGKMHANPFPSTGHTTSKPLELVHMDVYGPTPVASPEGYRYYALYADDHTKFKVAIPMKKKSETFGTFLQFKAFAENHFGQKIK